MASNSSSSLVDVMSITPLGSGQEVGRSCHLLQFRGLTILLDCGIHPGYEGLNGLPFFDQVEPEEIDLILISHFHLDHAASLPYFTERTGFKGRIFMTHPTKAVIRLLLGDYLRLMNINNNSTEVLYTEADLQKCMDKVELIDFHQVINLTTKSNVNVKFHALNAGHVLGAAMFLLDIGGRTVLYTGDYSMEDDRHLMAAEIPNINVDLLIVESTYGVQVHASRQEREARFTGTVDRIVSRGGRCLIPVFALGRAQELLLILDEYWQANPHLQSIPIWYASKLASKALRVYQTYANMMNARIRAQMDVANPFSFQYIRNLKTIDNVELFDDRGPSVVFASPGMLQSGVSRKLFDRWCTDNKNGVIIAGYAVENTLAKEIMNQPQEVMSMEGRTQPLNCLVDYVSFSAHVDFVQNRDFITKVQPKHIILVHGSVVEMGRFKSAMQLQQKSLPENKRPTITMPPNLQEVKLEFTRRRAAKVIGKLANRNHNDHHHHGGEPKEGESVEGILVTQNFNSKIVAPEDLATYTQLRIGSVSSKLHVPYAGSIDTLRLFFNEMFTGVTERELEFYDTTTDATSTYMVYGLHQDQIKVTVGKTKGVATVEWDASPVRDLIADSVIALLMHAQSSSAAIRITSQPCNHSNNGNNTPQQQQEQQKEIQRHRLELAYKLMTDQFSNVEATYTDTTGTFIVRNHDNEQNNNEDTAVVENDMLVKAVVEFYENSQKGMQHDAKITVTSSDEKIAANVQDCLHYLTSAAAPIPI